MSTHPSAQSVTVGQVLSVLHRRLRAVLACMIVGGVLAGLYAVAAPASYSATAVVTLVTLPDNPLDTGTSTRVVNTATESQVVRSTAIAQRVATAIGSSDSPAALIQRVTVTSPLNSQALQISYQGSTAKAAARGANAFAQAYLGYRSEMVGQQVNSMSTTLDKQISNLTALQERAQVTALDGATAVERANARQTVKDEAYVLQQLRGQRAQLDNASRTAGTLVGQAEAPTAPAGPSIVILIAAGLAIGFIGGMALALIRDRTDDHIRDREQIESDLRLPVIADIPLGKESSTRPSSLQTDVYRRLAAILTSSQNVAGTNPLLLVTAGDTGRRDVAAKLSSAIAGQVGSAALVCTPSAVALNLTTAQMGIWHSAAPQVESFGAETELRNGRPLNAPVGDAEMIVIDGINVEHASTPLVLASTASSVLIVARIGATLMTEISDLVRELRYTGANIQGVILLHPANQTTGRKQPRLEPLALPDPTRLPTLGGFDQLTRLPAPGSNDQPARLPIQPPVRPSQQSVGYPGKGQQAGWPDANPITAPISVVNGTNGNNGSGEQRPAKFMRLPSVQEK